MLLLLSLGCADIYLGGIAAGLESPFSREAAAERLHIIAPGLCGCALLSLGGAVGAFCSGGAPAGKNLKTYRCGNMGSRPAPRILRGVILTLAAAFILLGVMNGGARDILYKAIAICTECIGLG